MCCAAPSVRPPLPPGALDRPQAEGGRDGGPNPNTLSAPLVRPRVCAFGEFSNAKAPHRIQPAKRLRSESLLTASRATGGRQGRRFLPARGGAGRGLGWGIGGGRAPPPPGWVRGPALAWGSSPPRLSVVLLSRVIELKIASRIVPRSAPR